MARMTRAQLVDENIALRHNLCILEAKIAEYETELLHAKRSATRTVDEVPATAKRCGPAQPGDEVVVATYTKRDGSVWNKVRIGYNKFAHRPAQTFRVVAGKYDGDGENCKFCDVRHTLKEAEALLLTVSDYPWSRIEIA